MSKITYEDKVDIRTSELPLKNTYRASDFNEIKSAVNNIALLTHEVTLTKAQLNTINTDGGVELPLSQFGCQAGEDIQLYFGYPTAEVFRDGVDFDSSGRNIDIVKDSTTIASISKDVIQSTSDGNFGTIISVPKSQLYTNSLYTLKCINDITGGGPNAFIKIKLFYQIVKV